jgi:hypothetical protein
MLFARWPPHVSHPTKSPKSPGSCPNTSRPSARSTHPLPSRCYQSRGPAVQSFFSPQILDTTRLLVLQRQRVAKPDFTRCSEVWVSRICQTKRRWQRSPSKRTALLRNQSRTCRLPCHSLPQREYQHCRCEQRNTRKDKACVKASCPPADCSHHVRPNKAPKIPDGIN